MTSVQGENGRENFIVKADSTGCYYHLTPVFPSTEVLSTLNTAGRTDLCFWEYSPRIYRAYGQLREDLRADPYLPYLLVFAAVLASFWLWHGLPNFATRDERRRVLDPIQPVGRFIERPSLYSIVDGVTDGVKYGGTFYVYGLVLVPTLAVLVLTGNSDVIVTMANLPVVSTWSGWQSVPAWVWTATVLSTRLVNAVFAVGSVYVVYRLGTTVQDRATGRLAALLTSLTWGMLVLAHEAGEDVPALFFFLVALYLAVEYVDSGSRHTFYWGALCGGIATGLKFTAGVSAVVMGMAYLLQTSRTGGSIRDVVSQPRLLVTGALIGITAILVSYPQTLAGEPLAIVGRLGRGVESKGTPHGYVIAPSWWWIVRGYLNGLGLPLAVASVASVGAGIGWLRERSPVGTYNHLALVVIATTLLVFARWAYIRTHHLLVTFPVLALLVAIGGRRLIERRETTGRVLVAGLVLSTGAYAIAGDLGYANQGRDNAAEWLSQHADSDATVETYTNVPQEAGVPYGPLVYQPDVPDNISHLTRRCPDYVVLNYHHGLLYAAPTTLMARARWIADADAREYVDTLLKEREYPYEVAKRFGRRPRFLDGKDPRPEWWRLLRVGTRPRTIQYGDPQDVGVDQYTVILERTGPC